MTFPTAAARADVTRPVVAAVPSQASTWIVAAETAEVHALPAHHAGPLFPAASQIWVSCCTHHPAVKPSCLYAADCAYSSRRLLELFCVYRTPPLTWVWLCCCSGGVCQHAAGQQQCHAGCCAQLGVQQRATLVQHVHDVMKDWLCAAPVAVTVLGPKQQE